MSTGGNIPAQHAENEPFTLDIDAIVFSTVAKSGFGCKLLIPQTCTEAGNHYAARSDLDTRCAFNCGGNCIVGNVSRRSHCDSNGGGLVLDELVD
jgi:hypothetical protein